MYALRFFPTLQGLDVNEMLQRLWQPQKLSDQFMIYYRFRLVCVLQLVSFYKYKVKVMLFQRLPLENFQSL